MERLDFQLNEYAAARRRDRHRARRDRTTNRRDRGAHPRAVAHERAVQTDRRRIVRQYRAPSRRRIAGVDQDSRPGTPARGVARARFRPSRRCRVHRRRRRRSDDRGAAHDDPVRACSPGPTSSPRSSPEGRRWTDQPHPQIIIIKRRASQRGRAPRRRLEDRVRRFHDGDDGVLPRALDHQRDRQEHEDHYRALFQSGEIGGVRENAQEHPRRRHVTLAPADVSDAKNRGASGAAGPEDSKKTNDDQASAAKSGDGPREQGRGQIRAPGQQAPRPSRRIRRTPSPRCPKAFCSADPYRSLDAIAGPSSPNVRAIAQSERLRDPAEAGSADPEAFRDPFRPIGTRGDGGRDHREGARTGAGRGRRFAAAANAADERRGQAEGGRRALERRERRRGADSLSRRPPRA